MMKTASQLLSEASDLKKQLGFCSSLSSNELWNLQYQLQSVCGQLLLGCQELALEKGVERELWNFGFRNTITHLQAELKEKQGSGSSEAKDLLNYFLNSASGFYIQLLNQICSTYSLDLPFRRKDSLFGITSSTSWSINENKQKEGTSKNARYLCQHCLVHLGDLARYKHQARQAETFYKHALSVGPFYGQAYNQLGLLEVGRGNRLSAVALYIRAVCLQAPFPNAWTNLHQTLLKILSGGSNRASPSDVKVVRMTKDEYNSLFLKLHSYLLLHGDIKKAKEILPQLSSALSTLVVTSALTRSMLVQMVIINLFTLSYFSRKIKLQNFEENNKKKDEESPIKFVDPTKHSGCSEIIEELLVAMLAALLLPVHTIKDHEVLLTYTALPAIRQLLEWLKQEDKVSCSTMKRKQQIWAGLCTLVNSLQVALKLFQPEYYSDVPLPEDWDLQGFQPLQKMLSNYNYKEILTRPSPEEYNMLRVARLVELAKWFSQQTQDGNPIIKVRSEGESDDTKLIFEPQQHLSPPPEEVRVLEELTSKSPPQTEKGKSKKGKMGILKPEGSLEKSWEGHQEPNPSNKVNKSKVHLKPEEAIRFKPEVTTEPSVSLKSRAKSNVALQAILKRNSAAQEAKQVTFKTPSPAISPNLSEASNDSEHNKRLSSPPPLIPHMSFIPKTYPQTTPQFPPNMSTIPVDQRPLPQSPWSWKENMNQYPMLNTNTRPLNIPPNIDLTKPPPPLLQLAQNLQRHDHPPADLSLPPPPDLSVPPPPDLSVPPPNLISNMSALSTENLHNIGNPSQAISSTYMSNLPPVSMMQQFSNMRISSQSSLAPPTTSRDYLSSMNQSRNSNPSQNLMSAPKDRYMQNFQNTNPQSGQSNLIENQDLHLSSNQEWNRWNTNLDNNLGVTKNVSPTLHQLLQTHPSIDLNERGLASLPKLNMMQNLANNPLASLPISQPQHPLSQEAGEGRVQGVSTYSLFSPMGRGEVEAATHNPLYPIMTPPPMSHQSLWSGPGPSPLERLLEQKKHGGPPK